MTSDAP